MRSTWSTQMRGDCRFKRPSTGDGPPCASMKTRLAWPRWKEPRHALPDLSDPSSSFGQLCLGGAAPPSALWPSSSRLPLRGRSRHCRTGVSRKIFAPTAALGRNRTSLMPALNWQSGRPPTQLDLWVHTLPRPRRAAQRLRRLAEGADEGAAHPLRIAKAGGLRDAFDRLAGGLHALPRHLDPQALHRL
jgi:hypothetical protein